MREQAEAILRDIEHNSLDKTFNNLSTLFTLSEQPGLLSLTSRFTEIKKNYYAEGVLSDRDFNAFRKEILDDLIRLLHQIKRVSQTPLITNLKSEIAPPAHFTGRADLLLTLEENYKNTHVQILYGMDGLGKSSIAAAYAYRHWSTETYHRLIWWINAKLPIHIESGLEDLFDQLPADEKPREGNLSRTEQVIRWLETHSSWLIVFDNVEDVGLLQKILPKCLGHVLITTGNLQPDTEVPDATWVPVPVLTDDASIQLLRAKSKDRLSAEEAADYVEFCGGSPLLLSTIGAYHAANFNNKHAPKNAFIDFLKRDTDINKKFFALIGEVRKSVFALKPRKICDYFVNVYTILALGSFDGNRIPRQLLTDMLEQFTDYKESEKFNRPDAWFWQKFVARIFRMFHDNLARGQHELLQKLAERSFVTEINEDYLQVHIFIQYQFLDIYFLPEKKVLHFNIGGFLKSLNEVFAINERRPASDRVAYDMIPHFASVIERAQQTDLVHPELLKLTKNLVSLLIYKERYATARQYSEYAFKLDKILNKVSSYEILLQGATAQVITGTGLATLDPMLESWKQDKTYDLSTDLLLRGLNEMMNGDPAKALAYYQHIINMSAEETGYNPLLTYAYMLAANGLLADNSTQSETYLAIATDRILANEGMDSEAYAHLLGNKADICLANAASYEDEADEYAKALELYTAAYSIICAHKSPYSLSGLLLLFGQAKCNVALGDMAAAATLYQILSTQNAALIEGFGKDHIIFQDIKLLGEMVEDY